MNLTGAIAEQARRRPGHPALEDGGRVVAYAELDRMVDAAAARLAAAGIGPGDLVAVRLADSVEHVVLHLALIRAGAVSYTVGPGVPPEEALAGLAGMMPKALVAEAPLGDLPVLAPTALVGGEATALRAYDPNPGDPVTLNTSSGTTGRPKAILRHNAQTFEWVERHRRHLGWCAEDRHLLAIGMSFDLGRTILLSLLRAGGTVMLNRARDAQTLVEAVVAGRATALYLSVMHMRTLLGLPARSGPLFPNLRALYVGTSRVAYDELRQARARLTPNLYETFGSTETGCVGTLSPADQDAAPDAVARIFDEVEVGIVDADGRPLPPGEVGLLRFRVKELSAGYLNDAEASARAFRDGWFLPGDLAALDAERRLHFKGRADDVINNAGAKFYPVEVENVLLSHPQVREAAVFGWPHPRLGEVAVAAVAVEGELDQRALNDFCARRLVRYKLPQTVMVMAELPKNPMGKILKRRLKATLAAHLARQTKDGSH